VPQTSPHQRRPSRRIEFGERVFSRRDGLSFYNIKDGGALAQRDWLPTPWVFFFFWTTWGAWDLERRKIIAALDPQLHRLVTAPADRSSVRAPFFHPSGLDPGRGSLGRLSSTGEPHS